MKLLEKNEIQQKKNAERRMEIEEGAKLARKVDNLRETAASEEARLSKFRDANLKKIKEEIDSLISKRDALTGEVERLTEEKRKFQIPLDKEWEKVREDAEKLKTLSGELEDKQIILSQTAKELDDKKRELEIEESRVNDLKLRTKESLRKAEEKLRQSVETLKEADDKKKEADEYEEWKKQELSNREALVATRERDTDIRSENLVQRENELNNRERFINDKYQTLLRTENLIKKHGNR